MEIGEVWGSGESPRRWAAKRLIRSVRKVLSALEAGGAAACGLTGVPAALSSDEAIWGSVSADDSLPAEGYPSGSAGVAGTSHRSWSNRPH